MLFTEYINRRLSRHLPYFVSHQTTAESCNASNQLKSFSSNQ